MKCVRRIVYGLLLTAAANALPLVWLLYAEWSVSGAGWLFCVTATATVLLQLLWLAVHPPEAPRSEASPTATWWI